MRFLQLGEYVLLRQLNFITSDIESYFNLQIEDPMSIRAFIKNMKLYQSDYAKYVVLRMGYRHSMAELAGYSYTVLETLLNRYKAKNYLCAMENYDIIDYYECLDAWWQPKQHSFCD